MDGIFGWLGQIPDPQSLFDAMHQATRCAASPNVVKGEDFLTAALSQFAHAHTSKAHGLVAALQGCVRFADPALQRLALDQGPAAALLAGWRNEQTALLPKLHGAFSLAVLEPSTQRAWLAIDRTGIGRLCFGTASNNLVFGTSALVVATHPAIGRNIDLQAVFDYFYFHMIPSPGTLFRGISKLLPGECVSFDQGHTKHSFYWRLDYTPEPSRDYAAFREHFRQHLKDGVRHKLDDRAMGAFLSGGTDSSTVVGTLTEVTGHPVETFSIGFDAEGFDEMEYARIAARRFASHPHEYYLKPDDIVSAIPIIATEYDEPFGNDSAVPAYYCAKLARDHGIKIMMAGDGGDEIFGGNARYAKQKVFEAYLHLPGFLRQGLIEPLAHLPFLSDRLPLRKLRSYVDQANERLPDRLEAYNFLHRSPLSDIFVRDFLATVDPSAPARQMRVVYERTNHPDPVKRMMHVDLKFTLADNDLRKVVTMCEAAEVEARFPLLDDDLLSFSGQLPPDYLVKGLKLRWFFKEALRDLLPEEIINKNKHGFGLPFGPWSVTHGPLRDLAGDSLSALTRRGWVRKEYLDHILHHQQNTHASYYGIMIWVAMILEQWLQAHEL